MNGVAGHANLASSPRSHLGKRRRSSLNDERSEIRIALSPESVKDDLQVALQTIKKYDSTGSILRRRLTSRPASASVKRQRRASSQPLNDCLEDRFRSNAYKSLEEVITDIREMQESSDTNGKIDEEDMMEDDKENVKDHELDNVIKQKTLDKILQDLVKQLRSTPPANSEVKEQTDQKKEIFQQTAQVLSLRSQTETGVKQLFSGLPIASANPSADLDGKTLPNGFELTDALMINRSTTTTKDIRTFGDVFAPHRNTKSLESPRVDRRYQGLTNISFIPSHTMEVTAANKFDYKHTALTTGSWLQYFASGDALPDDPGSIRKSEEDPTALFKSSFSSFAPSTDHTTAIVTEPDRSRHWWRERMTKRALPDVSEDAHVTYRVNESSDAQLSDDFEALIENFVSEVDLAEMLESERLLEEVSELLETLYSHQLIRDSGEPRSLGPKKPSSSETDTYNMLRDQLKILVAALPPFALAKLDGDQLQALNISTHISVAAPEFSGTAQADESTLRRNKAAQSAAISASRQAVGVPPRNNYNSPAASYNNQSYNRNASTASYPARAPAAAYNTPRATTGAQAAPYSYQNYRAPNSGANATIQQYQRAAAAAAAAQNYNQNATQTPQSYLRQPSQPSYQQRAQDNGSAYTRNGSPHVASSAGPVAQPDGLSNGVSNQQQQATSQARQSSGTPQPVNGVMTEGQRVPVPGTS